MTNDNKNFIWEIAMTQLRILSKSNENKIIENAKLGASIRIWGIHNAQEDYLELKFKGEGKG